MMMIRYTTFAVFALACTACSSKDNGNNKNSTPSATSASTVAAAQSDPPASKSAATPVTKPAVKPGTTPAAPTGALEPCDGRSILFEWQGGMLTINQTLSCKNGKVIGHRENESYGTQVSMNIDAVTWTKTWRALEAASWRTVVVKCDEGEARYYTNIEIQDGDLKKSFTCLGTPDTPESLDALVAAVHITTDKLEALEDQQTADVPDN